MLIPERTYLPSERLRALRQCIREKGFARILEAHSGLSGIVAENVRAERDGQVIEFDGIWESSLTDSARKGLPDASIVGYDSRAWTIDEILNVTTKPLIVDGDTGCDPLQFEFLVRQLERLGVSAVIIEDKVFPKRNSLDRSAAQKLEDPEVFARKIARGRNAAITDDFLVIARLESLIAGAGLDDAVDRARRYIRAGADGIMIHSNRRSPHEVLAFARRYRSLCRELRQRPYLVCVPTTYNRVTERELVGEGFDIIIHANHLLRSAYQAMTEVARTILTHGRSLEADDLCCDVKEIFAAVGYDRIGSGQGSPKVERAATGASPFDKPFPMKSKN